MIRQVRQQSRRKHQVLLPSRAPGHGKGLDARAGLRRQWLQIGAIRQDVHPMPRQT